MVVHNGVIYKECIECENNEKTILEVCKLLITFGRKPAWIIMNEHQYAQIYYN
jgi:hypothetical protein